MAAPLFGVVGWKNSGKTALMVGLIGELTRRGFAVSVIKHAHARFEIDHEGRELVQDARGRRVPGRAVVAPTLRLDARA